jgi:YD repeat-containing protein
MAGYTYQAEVSRLSFTTGYFAATERRRYDFHNEPDGKGRGLPLIARDPLGRDTSIVYDTYGLFPATVTDPAGLITSASYDYRVLQPREVTDPNGNKTVFTFTPMGLIETISVRGKLGTEGDQSRPSARMEYDFFAFANSPSGARQPIRVRTIRRVHHDTETDVPLPDRDQTIEAQEYSDGFGRLLQTRSQAEEVRFGDDTFGGGSSILPASQSAGTGGDVVGRRNDSASAPNVVVSGWQIYDNKGEVVQKYEPFFATGWDYAAPTDAQLGQKATMYYDPRGRTIRTVNPDGSEQRVVYGGPVDLADPDNFSPTPWEIYTYDVNDNAAALTRPNRPFISATGARRPARW